MILITCFQGHRGWRVFGLSLRAKEELRGSKFSNNQCIEDDGVNVQTLSVGGEEAEVSEFPWAALLVLRSSETNLTSRCGGSLISDRHVLTAGHCLRETDTNGEIDYVYDDITIELGEIIP